MTLGVAIQVWAVEAGKKFPNSPADAGQYLVQKCKTAGLQPPKNPPEYVKYWQDRQTPKGDISSNAQRSGRKPKLSAPRVQAAYRAILACAKAGRDRPYESADVIATECKYVKKLLAETGARISTLIARIRQLHPRFGRHLLRARWHMTAECEQDRLATAQDLLSNYGDKLDYVVHFDAKTVYLQEKEIYGYVDLAVGYTVSHIAAATKNSRVIKLRYYAAVNAKLGAFFIMYYTGTADLPANRRGAHYKVSSGVQQHRLAPGSHILHCLPELCSPLLGSPPEVGVALLHPHPQHTPPLLNCCLGVRIVPALPCANAIICVVGLCHQPAAVPLPHHFHQQPGGCDHSQIPPLSAGVYHNALTHPHRSPLAQAACFHSILLNQHLSICYSIQHPLWLAAPASTHAASQGAAAGVGGTHRHVGTVLAELLANCACHLVGVLVCAAVGEAAMLQVVDSRQPCLLSLLAVLPTRPAHFFPDTPAAAMLLMCLGACRNPQERRHWESQCRRPTTL